MDLLHVHVVEVAEDVVAVVAVMMDNHRLLTIISIIIIMTTEIGDTMMKMTLMVDDINRILEEGK